MVQLPPRVDEVHHLSFTSAELEMYETTKVQSRVLLEEAISSGRQDGKTFNALRLLNTLRVICNHGLLTRSTLGKNITQCSQRYLGGWSSEEASSLPCSNILGNACCSNCGRDLLEDILEGPASATIEPRATPFDKMICERCNAESSCGSLSQSARVITENPDSSECSTPATTPADSDEVSIGSMSTKIKALVEDLYKHYTSDKRSFPISIWYSYKQLIFLVLCFLTGPIHLILFN